MFLFKNKLNINMAYVYPKSIANYMTEEQVEFVKIILLIQL